MTKPQHHIWLVFKNIPYSDEEWELMKYYAPRKTRPVRPIRYGGGVHSETEARRRCEQALANGAQQVEYSIYGDKGHVSTWKKRKGGDWYGKKPLRKFS